MSNFLSVQFFGDSKQCYTYKNKYNTKVINKNDFVIVPTPRGNTVAKVINVDLPIPSHLNVKRLLKR